MPIKAIVFDADGVVLVPKRFSEYLAREYHISEAETRAFFYGALEECILGRADLKEILSPFLAQWCWPHSVDEFLQQWFVEGDAVDQQVLNVIKALRQRGLICCLATNQEKYRIHYMRTTMGFDQIFDHIFFAAQIGHKKTDQEFYSYVQEVLAVPSDQILLWDDGQDNVDAALVHGWHAQLFTTFDVFEHKLNTYLLVT